MIVILGVDPGLTGALAWLTYCPDSKIINLLGVMDVPTVKVKVGKSLRAVPVPALLRDTFANPIFPKPNTVVIEQVHAMPGQGVTSMFNFGHIAGMLAGVAAGLGLPLAYLRSNEWQVLSGVRKGTNDAGRLRASGLFPGQAHMFHRVKDHNRADAVLIGYAFIKKEFP